MGKGGHQELRNQGAQGRTYERAKKCRRDKRVRQVQSEEGMRVGREGEKSVRRVNKAGCLIR